ncbi:snRNA-activating protein complex subunit 2-like [Rhea pennata]|uniref:snRNA-activating protein complex subunit 2-like n=1 Tax=Rhea pennata TaxID=8795 RepID=UPI002E26A1A6
MKPPLRTRLAPARYVTGPGAAAPEPPRAAWSAREKRALLGALRAQAALGAAELDPRRLRERLPRRSEAEILAFVSHLKGRVAREAVCTEYRQCLEEQRRRRAEVPAPIEVWTDLAEKLSEQLEEATAAAFSQVLTVAGTEPLSLLRSVRPPERRDASGAGAPDFAVDFEKVYGYLALVARGGRAPPPPPPGEAAVLLALLASLPPELAALDRAGLGGHLRRAYGDLAAPRPPPGEPHGGPHGGPHGEQHGGPTAGSTTGPTASTMAGPTAGSTTGPTASPTAGPMASTMAGPTAGSTTGPTAGPMASTMAGPTAGSTTGPTASTTASPTAGPTVGSTVSPMADPPASTTAGPTASPPAGPTASPPVGPPASPPAGPTASPTASPMASPTVGPPASPLAGSTADPPAGPPAAPRRCGATSASAR